ncbi:MAG: hypothetical protein HQL23_09010, partial [Candidatus Omnitrophica bacterium]|nr:hypothetical protein [Candidatus Omnitrophota bacterium]
IDGTRLYANRMPLFGISIGLIRDLKPWIGAVYFPALRELFLCDGEQSYFIRDPFTPQESRQRITTMDEVISPKSLFLMSDMFFHYYDWDLTKCRFLVTACATVNLCWPTIGRGCGSLDQSHLWDFAGAWPIARSAGMEFRDITTGQVMDHIDAGYFVKEKTPWKLKAYHILSSERNYPLLRQNIIPKP